MHKYMYHCWRWGGRGVLGSPVGTDGLISEGMITGRGRSGTSEGGGKRREGWGRRKREGMIRAGPVAPKNM